MNALIDLWVAEVTEVSRMRGSWQQLDSLTEQIFARPFLAEAALDQRSLNS